jgi:hypothetical protein
LIEENGILYEIGLDGEKRLFKKLVKSKRVLPNQFQLI